MKKAALHNLGCKVNAYETEAMQQMLEEAGYEIVPFTEAADVYVINTCSVTNIADRKSRQMIHRARKLNPKGIVVAAGCYVQTREAEARADASIDLCIGNNCKHELVERLEILFRERENGGNQENSDQREFDDSRKKCENAENGRDSGRADAIIDINEQGQCFEELFLSRTAEHTRAFIKVQDGCNQFCSYCIIPYARGRVRSRTLSNVLEEVKRLAASGCQEVVLTGIHLSSYGTDCGENLLHLIREVHGIEGIARIRLGSLEPKIVTEEFAKELSRMEKICPHFHLSLQSGCDATLKRMNRKYTTAEYEGGCNILRRYFEHPAITTDVIVGFPGETEEEFLETEAFLRRIRFYEMHVFKYSKRQGTRAAVMEGQVPEEIKTARSNRLLALDEEMSEEFRQYYAGSRQEVLFEEFVMQNGKKCYTGYTREYVKVTVESEKDLVNRREVVEVNVL